ncbi:MAG: 16S rRNA (guanine1516-N2)-methyltransferase [Gammaproteobacteria bacterium]|jgi:16S rRNA (guanine1516-N2)-methyltransferase
MHLIHHNKLADTPNIKITQHKYGCQVTMRHSTGEMSYDHSFTDSQFINRLTQNNQALFKASDNKQKKIKTVMDITAGWGIDAFLLASRGKKVTMIEQNPDLVACIQYALIKAADHPLTRDITQLITVLNLNALQHLRSYSGEPPDCIYIDPMFPERKSYAQSGKDLQILQAITYNRDLETCMDLALKLATKRVVVKRPLKSENFAALKPDIIYREKSVRFDVYLTI